MCKITGYTETTPIKYPSNSSQKTLSATEEKTTKTFKERLASLNETLQPFLEWSPITGTFYGIKKLVQISRSEPTENRKIEILKGVGQTFSFLGTGLIALLVKLVSLAVDKCKKAGTAEKATEPTEAEAEKATEPTEAEAEKATEPTEAEATAKLAESTTKLAEATAKLEEALTKAEKTAEKPVEDEVKQG